MREVLAVDLGSQSVKAVVGEQDGERLLIKGYSQVPTEGALRAGGILDMAKASEKISEAARSAAQVAGVRAELLDHAVGITGAQVHAKGCRGTVATRGSRGITEADIKRAKEQAKISLRLPSDHEVLYLYPNYYLLDNKTSTRNPLNFQSRRLEIVGYVVTAERTYLDNLMVCLIETPISEPVLFFQPIAASFGVLSDEDFEEGAILLDIGRSITQLAVWREGMLLHVDVVPGGGANLAEAVAREFKTTKALAQWAIEQYGFAGEGPFQDETIVLRDPHHNTQHEISRSRLGEVVGSALEAQLARVSESLDSSGVFSMISPGTVLVLVGGVANLPGVDALAQEIFGMPAVIGKPKGIEAYEPEVEDPRFAVAVGLVKMALKEEGKSLKRGFLKGLSDLIKKIKEVF